MEYLDPITIDVPIDKKVIVVNSDATINITTHQNDILDDLKSILNSLHTISVCSQTQKDIITFVLKTMSDANFSIFHYHKNREKIDDILAMLIARIFLYYDFQNYSVEEIILKIKNALESIQLQHERS